MHSLSYFFHQENEPSKESWRDFLGKRYLEVRNIFGYNNNGTRYKVQHPEQEDLSFFISEKESEEIEKSNKIIIEKIKTTVDNTNYKNYKTNLGDPIWRECLGKKYLYINFKKVQDPWNPEIWHALSYEESLEIKFVNEKYQLNPKKENNTKDRGVNRYLTKDGYLSGNFESRLASTLEEKDLDLGEVSEYLENLPVHSTNQVTKREKKDIYERKITTFLKKYQDSSLENIFIPDFKLIEIGNLIIKGNFGDDKFLKFGEQLQSIQKRNYIQYYKRMYFYGYLYGERGFKTQPQALMEIDCIPKLIDFFKEGYKIEDLGDTPEHFKERLLYTLKNNLYNTIYKYGDNSSIYYSHYKALGLSDKEINNVKREVKLGGKEFFLNKIKETVAIEKNIAIYLNITNLKQRDYENKIQEIESNNRSIKEICKSIARKNYLQKLDNNINEEDERYKNKVIEIITNYIQEGIKKIRLKEKIKKIPYFAVNPNNLNSLKEYFGQGNTVKHKNDLWYLSVLEHLVQEKIQLLKIFKTDITHNSSDSSNRYEERESYKHLDFQDYLKDNNYTKEFIINRVKDVLLKDIGFQVENGLNRDEVMEKLSPMIVKKSKYMLYELLLKETQKSDFYYSISPPQAMRFVQQALFIPGYSTTLKQFYPDEEERKAIRKIFIQNIIKELLSEIQTRLLSQNDFITAEYKMRNALLYVYGKYGGKDSFELDMDGLKRKIYQYEKDRYQQILEDLQAIFQQKKTNNFVQLYNNLYEFAEKISNKTFFFIKNKQDYLQTRPQKGILKERKNFQHTEYNPDIAKQLPIDIQTTYLSLWSTFETQKLQIFKEFLKKWGNENFPGRIKRIVEQTLYQKFGTLTWSLEQISFMYDYLASILENLIIADIKEEMGHDMRNGDLDLIKKELIQPAIVNIIKEKSLHQTLKSPPLLSP